MALLLDSRSRGQTSGAVARDLAAKLEQIQSMQQHLVPEGVFDIEASRIWFDEFARLVALDARTHPMSVSQQVFAAERGPVRTRVYTPRAYRSVLVFAHGGGWVIGSVDTHDHICRWLAAATGSQVISVDYALAPEHPYPAAIQQTAAVVSTVVREHQGDGRTIFLAGDSAGANVMAMALLSAGPEVAAGLAGFISIYGAYSPQMNLSSHKLYGDGRFGLGETQMRWFWNLYAPHVPPAERQKLTPVGADLSFFPPTLCIGAECDLLLDDTLAFYSGLAHCGVDVALSLWSGMTHGALHFAGIVDSVTTSAGSIVHYVDERRRSLGDLHPAAPASLVRALQGEPSGRLSATVMMGDDRLPDAGTVRIAPIRSPFLTSRSRSHGAVTHRLATEIIGGTYPPGSILPTEDAASTAFGVSRGAYREAVRTLAAKGLVNSLPKVGTRINERSSWRLLDPDVLAWHLESNCTPAFVRSLFEVRKVVEPSAAALAARRRDDAGLAGLAEAMSNMATRGPADAGWQQAVLDFHERMIACSENDVLAAMWPAIQVTLQWSLALQEAAAPARPGGDPVADHAKVFERIVARDAEGALQEMAYLIDGALSETLLLISRVAHSGPAAEATPQPAPAGA